MELWVIPLLAAHKTYHAKYGYPQCTAPYNVTHLLKVSLKPQVKVRQTLALLIFPIIITLYLCFLMKFAGYFNRQVKDPPRKDFLRPEQLLEGKVSLFF